MEKPIQSQEEYTLIRNSVIKETMRVTKCSAEQASKRADALFASHLLDGLHYSDETFQRIVDRYMTTEI